MKISKLYVRNFITVMAIIITAQVAIAGLFRIVGNAAGGSNFQSDISTIAFMLRENIDRNGNDKKSLSDFFIGLSKVWSTEVWLEGIKGNIIASSGTLPRPDFPGDMPELITSRGCKIYRNPGGPPEILLKMQFDDGRTVYARRISQKPYAEEYYFIIGLSIITIVVALILLPTSRRITKPLKRLTESANAIARGEFDRNVDESSHDEIGELAKAFNMMSARVLHMINGTRELTANISHQIRSPLARISVAAGILRDKISSGDTAGAEKNISFIENEIEEMDILTGRIIELLRVDTVHKRVDLEKIDLQQVAAATSVKYSGMFEKRNITHISETTSIACIISGVARDIQELFDILYDNAVRYTPPEGLISTEMHPEKGAIVLNISNTSHDMKGVQMEKLFEPFKRMAPEEIPGNGLGLAIAKRIVTNHDGVISAESSPGTFHIRVRFPV